MGELFRFTWQGTQSEESCSFFCNNSHLSSREQFKMRQNLPHTSGKNREISPKKSALPVRGEGRAGLRAQGEAHERAPLPLGSRGKGNPRSLAPFLQQTPF